jgi:hypothetical protein
LDEGETMMKRLLIIGMLTVAVLSFFLTGCEGGGEKEGKDPPTEERSITISPLGLEGEVDKEYTFKAYLNNYPADNYQYEWSIDGSVKQSGTNYSFITKFSQDGEYTIKVTLKDGSGYAFSAASGTSSVKVKIQSPAQYVWKLIEVLDFDSKAVWEASANDYWKFEYTYMRGNFGATTWHKDDKDYVAYGAVAVWSVPPKIIRGGEKVTAVVSLSETENTHKNSNSAASAFADFAHPALGLGARGRIDFASASGETAAVINGAGPTSDSKTLTAVAPEGSVGERIAIRMCFYMGASMGTYYVYEWQQN